MTRFKVHRLNEVGMSSAHKMATAFETLADLLLTLGCTNGRELQLAYTNLETACFWAKRAMAENEINQVRES